MFHILRSIILIAVLMTNVIQGAQADVILTFNQTGPILQIPYGSPTAEPQPRTGLIELSFVLTDQAFASGVDWVQRYGKGPSFWLLDGMVQIYLRVSGLSDSFSVNLWDFANPDQFRMDRQSTINVTSNAAGMPQGTVFYRFAGLTEILFEFNGVGNVSGLIGGDGSCNAVPSAGCSFSGTVVQSVPEPGSILMFGIGLLVLGYALRFRQA
jgi:hypothetical protein